MTIHEFGRENKDILLLIHPSVVMWDYFDYVIPKLEKDYHLIVPALPGHDPEDDSDYTSVEQIAAELAEWLTARGFSTIRCAYGCSGGGSVVLRMLAEQSIEFRTTILDGAITPYQLPRIATRAILIRDFLLLSAGKLGARRWLLKAFTSDEFSEEDMNYVVKVLRHISYRSIWRNFDSCNNYSMPDPIPQPRGAVYYWYAQSERKARDWDIRYMKKRFPETKFRVVRDVGHGGLAAFAPERFVRYLTLCMREEGRDE